MVGKRVKEILDAFEKLPREEQDEVFAHLFGVVSLPGVKPSPNEVTDEFKKIASEVFSNNDELFKKLAD
jgi:hypothetical protein